MSARVAIVIPYYQKQPGILAKAVRSVLAQEGGVDWTLVIVDDQSPVSARSELAELLPGNEARIILVEQPNGGPAAARNKALDSVPAGTEYVAFLDSDDEWIPSHLARAVAARVEGYDFYFADHYQLGQTVGAFRRAGRIDPAQHPRLQAGPELHSYAGSMFDQILGGNIIGTSTVVYRYARFPALRFRAEFVYAGEDYLFWLELSRLTPRIAFSAMVECTYGKGVNVFAGSGWGTEHSLTRLHYEIKYKKALPRLFELSARQLTDTRAAVRGLRRSFVADVLHRLRHARPLPRQVLKQHWRTDPQTFVLAPLLAMMIVLKR
jgi:succinoglycan biosynthesis protein ExoW